MLRSVGRISKNIKGYIAQHSKLSFERRKENTLKLINTLLEQFEVLFEEIEEVNKTKIMELQNFIDWIKMQIFI